MSNTEKIAQLEKELKHIQERNVRVEKDKARADQSEYATGLSCPTGIYEGGGEQECNAWVLQRYYCENKGECDCRYFTDQYYCSRWLDSMSRKL